jgi:hypothetical protein
MKPVDFRNETFASIQNRIGGSRAAVLAAWQKHGPCTTEQLAERSKLSILSLRPRTTELEDLGFVCLSEVQESKTEGTYRARTQGEHATWIARQISAAQNPQREMAL